MRKHYLDNIREITVLLVVLFHVIFIFKFLSSVCPLVIMLQLPQKNI